MPEGPSIMGRLLCWLGFHDFRVIDKSFGFSGESDIEKVQCRRCGETRIR